MLKISFCRLQETRCLWTVTWETNLDPYSVNPQTYTVNKGKKQHERKQGSSRVVSWDVPFRSRELIDSVSFGVRFIDVVIHSGRGMRKKKDSVRTFLGLRVSLPFPSSCLHSGTRSPPPSTSSLTLQLHYDLS